MKNVTLILMSILISFLFSNIAYSQSYRFPAEVKDLNAGEVWWLSNPRSHGEGRQRNALDMVGARFDQNKGRWTKLRPGVPSKDDHPNEDFIIWGKPVFAAASGKVMRCWRNLPDDPTAKIDLVFPPGKGRLGGGNQLFIDIGDGRVMLYAHLKAGSIPEGICPHSKQFLDCPHCTSQGIPSKDQEDNHSHKAQADIPPAERPRVEAGQFLGLVGNSGKSGGPHLHFDLREIKDDSFTEGKPIRFDKWNTIPAKFNSTYVQRLNDPTKPLASRWTPLKNSVIAEDTIKNAIWPSPFLLKGSTSGRKIGDVAIESMSQNRMVLAVKNQEGKLELIACNINFFPIRMIKEHRKLAGSIKSVEIIKTKSNEVVTAVKLQNNNLKLISWGVGSVGPISRKAEFTAGRIKKVAVTPYSIGKSQFVTAVQTFDNKFKIIVWDTKNSQGTASVNKLGSKKGGSTNDVVITKPTGFNGVVTAVRTQGKLKLIAWRISSDGKVVTRAGDILGEEVKKVSIIHTDDFIITASQLTDDRLNITSWKLSSNGEFTRKSSIRVGTVREVTLDKSFHSKNSFITAISDSNGKLRLIAWDILEDGKLWRNGQIVAGKAEKIASKKWFIGSNPSNPEGDYLFTALRNAEGNLKVINWKVNLKP